jgi:hypothetical protein
MTNEEIEKLEILVEYMLNNLFNSDLLVDDDVNKEIQCIKEIINILQDRISYY